jgi:hypothetical protein
MTTARWSVVEVVARLLHPDERAAVLGDLTECGVSAWQGLRDVLGLVLRRQLMLWKSWRPWLTVFGVTVPCSFLLMGVSLSVCQSYLWVIEPGTFHSFDLAAAWSLRMLVCHAALLLSWSWTAGFVVGLTSPRTIWVSAVLCCSPCLFCLTRFHVPSLSKFCLLLFLLPAIWGVRRGLGIARLRLSSAIALASATTLLIVLMGNSGTQRWWTPDAWVVNGTLTWPAWYLVLAARRFGRQSS